MAYRPRGFYRAELGDVEVVARGDELHLFHLTLPNHDRVAHLVSRDGLAWEALPTALTTGEPGALDDDQLWTVSVTPGPDGRFHMLYTALSTREGGRVQRVLRAVSDDLVRWEKVPGPAGEADPARYATDLAREPWVSWRDPKPLALDGRWVAAVCARIPDAPFLRRGAVGLLASDDLEAWSVEAPLFAPRDHFELECPQLFRAGGRLYLTAAVFEDRSQRYWVADALEGPFRAPPGGTRLAPNGHYAARVCAWGGRTALFCWHRAPGPGHLDPLSAAVLPAPLVLEPDGSGALHPVSWPAWASYAAGPAGPLDPARLAPTCANPAARRERAGGTVGEGFEAWLWPEERADLLLEGALDLAAARGGVLLGADDRTTGLAVELDPGERRLRLVRTAETTDPTGRPWYGREVVQDAPLDPPAGPIPLRLLAVGGEVEVSLAGRVVLATVLPGSPRGRVGLFAADGRVALTDARLTPMRPPQA